MKRSPIRPPSSAGRAPGRLDLISRLLALPSLFAAAGIASADLPPLVSYWPFEDSLNDSAPGGVVADNGTFAGAGGGYATGQLGRSLALPGSAHVVIPHSSDVGAAAEDLSISAWFKVAEWNRTWQTLLSKGEANAYRLARSGDSPTELAYAGGAADIAGGSVNDGAWHHVAAVSERGEGTFLYIDGVLVAEGASPNLTDAGLPLLIGENPEATGRQWSGEVDDVGIFSGVLTAIEVAAMHQLAADQRFRYTLSEVEEMFRAHQAGDGASIVLRGTTWRYADSDPGPGADFVLLDGDGSGMLRIPGPSVEAFVAFPAGVASGGTVTLAWKVTTPFNSVVIEPGVGDVSAVTDASGMGTINVQPQQTTTFTLTVAGAEGANFARTTVLVDIDPTVVRLNEFVANPADSGLKDEDGDLEDWIEIFNPGPLAVNLAGHYLTDDAANPTKWAFPPTTLQPGAYLLVFASGKDRASGPNIHTNFRLGAQGEYLALTRDDGASGLTILTAYAPDYPEQKAGFSYGIATGTLAGGYFSAPTPRAANGASADGFVADTTFSHRRGFYSAPFDLTIATDTEGAQIRYTIDGTTPTATAGTLYTGPIPITGTTTLRAVATKAGFIATNVDTQTFVFLDDVVTQYANGIPPGDWPRSSSNGQVFNYGMDPDITRRYSAQEMKDALAAIPTLSVVTDQNNLTHPTTGIYTNPDRHGQGWERPTSLELINPDGTEGFQIDAGIRVRGGFSRSKDNPKHAFRFFFRDEYGAGKLRYPLFGAEGATEFDKVDLRTSQNYSWSFQGSNQNTFLREVLGRDLQGATGQPYTRSRYYHLYLNGVYWGLYMTQERAEAAYAETYLGGEREDYDTVKSAGSSGGYNTEATDGSLNGDWRELWNLSRAQATSPTLARYLQMQGLNPDGTRNPALPVYLDVDNLIDYLLIIFYTGNYDAPLSTFLNGASNNWFGIRNRVEDDRGFAFFVHDGEHTMGVGNWGAQQQNRVGVPRADGSLGPWYTSQQGTFSKSNPQFLHQDLWETEEYRIRFADRAHQYFLNGGLLTPESVTRFIHNRRETVESVIIAEAARWGDSKRSTPFDKPDWDREVTRLLNSVVPTRSGQVFDQLVAARLYPELPAPVFSQHGGTVPPGFELLISNDSGNIYYTLDGSDPRQLGGGINPGATFVAGSNESLTLVEFASPWRFLDDGTDLGPSSVVPGTPSWGTGNWKHPLFADGGWNEGPGPLGYGGVSGVELNTTVSWGPDGANKHITTYFRHAFEITKANLYTALNVELFRDDGIIVYLNGHEVVRDNMPLGTVAWSTVSSTSVGGSGEGEIMSFAVNPAFLEEGTNVLAVELHQSDAVSSDLGFDIKLSAVRLNESNSPVPITGPTVVRARSFDNGTWSALNEAFFTPGVPASNQRIVISEVNYHPAPLTALEAAQPFIDDADDFEFVEILNISQDPVDLSGAAFVLRQVGDHLEGIEFTFPQGALIQPGERQVVVANREAFEFRYPGVPESVVAGDYANRLDNTGEWITLIAGDGSLLASFRYNDTPPWPPEPDGQGPTLVLRDPMPAPDYGDGNSWRASQSPNGSPGGSDGSDFVGNPNADQDRDGLQALVEFYLGTSDLVPSAEAHPVAGTAEDAGQAYLLMAFRRSPDATGTVARVERAFHPNGPWESGPEAVELVESVAGPDGRIVEGWRSTTPLDQEPIQFLRLVVELLP